ncbi:MAG: sulfatase-like hydrolase/transferase [Bacteroidetes bacterium]|nr:sulfatase-like hydrolase/transferase [Bacteroidota bacterium]
MKEFETNYLIVTIDSCRWDTFCSANMPYIKGKSSFRKAYSQGTYTLPSHKSIYQGILPSVYEKIPYYNRFAKSLFRINNREVATNSLVTFRGGTKNIIEGFNEKKYFTLGIGAMEWFRHIELTDGFQKFFYTAINAKKQCEIFFETISKIKEPFFALINFGETHEPYEYGRQIEPTLNSRSRMRSFINYGFLQDEMNKQISACEYLDLMFTDLICNIEKTISRGTVVIICSDHGECFGEDGLYGHGFYHQKIIEVPLGIFEINCKIL